MIYFTADTHFGHANIVKMCERSYPDVESMNEAMIEAWNEQCTWRCNCIHYWRYVLLL